MPIEAILFDKDGTLIDFQATYGPAISQVVGALCNGEPDLMDRLAGRLGCDLETGIFEAGSVVIAGSAEDIAVVCAQVLVVNPVEHLGARIDDLCLRYAAKSVTPFAGIGDMLARLKSRGLRLGVATNDAELNARRQLETLGVTSHFDQIIGYDSGFGQKPQPGQIAGFASAAGVPVGAVAMVGDALHDLTAARAAGAMAVGVATGFASVAELATIADIVIDDLGQLENALEIH